METSIAPVGATVKGLKFWLIWILTKVCIDGRSVIEKVNNVCSPLKWLFDETKTEKEEGIVFVQPTIESLRLRKLSLDVRVIMNDSMGSNEPEFLTPITVRLTSWKVLEFKFSKGINIYG